MSAPLQKDLKAALLKPGTTVQNRYRIVRQLGIGGMGAVYEALDLRLELTVAVKQTISPDRDLRKQFEREARLLARLNHSALPRVSDYFTEGDNAFLVMQHIAGVDLAQIIKRELGPLPQSQVVAWADQLLDALIYLHSKDRRIIHRDIKPHNLKLTPEGQIALLDFGLAKKQSTDASGETSQSGIFGYSPSYAPLEQIQGRGMSPQSDIYALGATLYHLLTGVKPSDALTRATALVNAKANPLKPADEINNAVSRDLAAILSRAMAQNPEDRYASAVEFREALRRLGRVGCPSVAVKTDNSCAAKQFAAATGETTLVRNANFPAARINLGSRAIAATIIFLLLAFGVFCRYYPWKLPAGGPETVTTPQLTTRLNELGANNGRTKIIASRKPRR